MVYDTTSMENVAANLTKPVTDLAWDLGNGLKIHYLQFRWSETFRYSQCYELAKSMERLYRDQMTNLHKKEGDFALGRNIYDNDAEIEYRLTFDRDVTYRLIYAIVESLHQYAQWWDPDGRIPASVVRVDDARTWMIAQGNFGKTTPNQMAPASLSGIETY